MSTLEERVAYLEGQVSEQSHGLVDVRDAIRRLEERMDARFDAIERRFETTDRRIDGLDDRVSRQWESLDGKMSRQFVWLVGMQVTTLAAILVAVVGALISLG
jgi:uncharacterized coiled-coil protein SlyX